MNPSFGEALSRLWPRGDSKIPGLRAAMAEQAPAIFAKFGFDTDDVVAIFMGQLSEECGGGTEVVENLSYSAKRMTVVWPSRFPSVASPLPYANNPRKLANKVYNGRMENRAGSDDGYDFRGRGGSQTTGREGYRKLSEATGLDLIGNPDLVNDPAHFLECAAADFVKCGCLPFAKLGDVEGVTHHLNGGLTNLSARKDWTRRWRAALAVAPAPKPVDDGVLRLGDKGFEVEALQRRLVELGYSVGAIDKKFGRATRVAVIALQLDRGLPGTGEVDAATKEALKRDLMKPVSEERATADVGALKQSGSETIAKAEKLTFWGKLGFGTLFGGGAAHESGLLDKAQSTVDQVSTLRSIADSAQDVLGWALHYWWAFAAVGCFLAWKFGGDIIKRRLADHRAGTNMGL